MMDTVIVRHDGSITGVSNFSFYDWLESGFKENNILMEKKVLCCSSYEYYFITPLGQNFLIVF